MINRIPLKVFQICSIILFFLVLLKLPINKYILNDSDILSISYGFLVLILNPIVFLGYYKLAIDNNIPTLKKSSLILAITTFFVLTINNILSTKFTAIGIFESPLLYSPYFILGAAIIYFSISFFKINILNNRNTMSIAIITIITGLIYLSFVFISLIYFANWFFYGVLARYLFPKEKIKFKKQY